MSAKLARDHRRLEDYQLHLRQISPLTVLSRGYAIVKDTTGRVIRSSEETAAGDILNIRLHAGELAVEVSHVVPKPQ
jgi:exodeoxyribonuclease VII large subunit